MLWHDNDWILMQIPSYLADLYQISSHYHLAKSMVCSYSTTELERLWNSRSPFLLQPFLKCIFIITLLFSFLYKLLYLVAGKTRKPFNSIQGFIVDKYICIAWANPTLICPDLFRLTQTWSILKTIYQRVLQDIKDLSI